MRFHRTITRLCAIASANLMIVAATLALTSSGCSASTRAKALQTTFTASKVAHIAWIAWDQAHHKQLIAGATSVADANAKLAAWQPEEAKIELLFDAVIAATQAAQIINDKPSLDAVEKAGAALAAELAKYTAGAP